ncbi:glycosyltransferase family 9 protein [Parasediminibacterium paludis]|uniref:Glycosyltransferase family 9 protein n=1 Tax=Parasediminibacterium paludis TaxID=908966 RepID=A0ABV8Q2M4_9BACT
MASDTIMIYRIGSLGDTLMALPAFNRIRELFPSEKIVLLSNKPVVSKAAAIELVLGNHFFFDEIINYPVSTRNVKLLIALIFKIRSYKIKQLFYLTPCTSRKRFKRDILFFKLAGVKSFAAIPEIEADFTVTKDIDTGLYEWEAKRIARRLIPSGTFDFNEQKYWDLHLTKSELAAGNGYIKHLPKNSINICVSPGTKMQSKDWGRDNWMAFLTALSISYPSANIIVLGAQEESALADDLLNGITNSKINLCGRTSPRESAVILQSASVFIGQDSGPMHLAATVGIPCVAIFSSRNLPMQWFPRGNKNVIIYHMVDCAGCDLEICIKQKKKCILSITVSEVISAVHHVLSNTTI